MNKQITRWIKRVGIAICSVAILILGIYSGYEKVYLPYHYNSLYEMGISNMERSDSIADELATLHQHQMAIQLLTKAARKGVVKAQTKLALYLKGYEKDYKRSSYWYYQAALNGDSDAQYELGINYIYGYGVRQNFNKVIYWIKRSAENKNRWAQYELGNLYLNGLAYYDLDYEHTNFWYIGNNTFRSLENTDYKASDDEIDEILSNPKVIFLTQNLTKAKYYWSLSAKQGCEEAQEALEKIYE